MSTLEPGCGLHEASRAQHSQPEQASLSATHHEKCVGGRAFHKRLIAAAVSVAAAVVVVCGAATTASANPLEAAVSLFSSPVAQSLDDHTVTTTSPSGTTFNLFDYWVNPDDQLSVYGSGGINANHPLQFTTQGGSPMNRWTGSETPRTNIVRNVLLNGYPQLSANNGGESLGYLFDSTAHTGKIAHMGVSGLLQAQDGYYVYDSSHNYAAYNADKNAFDVYDMWGVNAAGGSPQRPVLPVRCGRQGVQRGKRPACAERHQGAEHR